MIRQFLRIFRTLKHLKFIQIRYQIWYRLKKIFRKSNIDSTIIFENITYLDFLVIPPSFPIVDIKTRSFEFLNQRVIFDSKIDWAYDINGKLWNYNLQYLNFALDEKLDLEVRLEWIMSLYLSLKKNDIPIEPYPASLRSINIIRFISLKRIQCDNKNYFLFELLYNELIFIEKNLEFHILGNHLLENLFSLIMGGAFFSNPKWINKAKSLLRQQLDEQILSDGGHFELSAMYHQIILFRILELIDWYSSFLDNDTQFVGFLQKKAEKMCSWLSQISFKNGEIPHFNDSSNGIAYSTEWLIGYSGKLDINKILIPLGASGYRAFNFGHYECRVDVAAIGATFQSGHGHADALSFILYKDFNPIFVEAGTSTYQKGERRNIERATYSHNTVTINGLDQSEVWGGFRVGSRANVSIEEETQNSITATHDGYHKLNAIHRRRFDFYLNRIIISDSVVSKHYTENIAYFHLHPNLNDYIELKNGDLISDIIEFKNYTSIKILPFQMADGFNNLVTGKCIQVNFDRNLTTIINLK